MTRTANFHLLGQDLVLDPDRALYWRQESLLVVADPHFGKTQVFRESGVPVPKGTTDEDLDRLSRLLERFSPRRLLFLGDLLHGRMEHARDLERRVDRWRMRHGRIECLLVTGNHDRRSGGPPAAFRFDRIVPGLAVGPFAFIHEPASGSSGYTISGHLHPAVVVTGKARQKEILPCFCFGPRLGLLPAFGSFTGNRTLHPAPGDRVYGIAGEEVLEIPAKAGEGQK